MSSFPLRKEELLKIILKKNNNLKVLGKIIHPIVRKKMKNFMKTNKNKKFVILDIPLFLENKLDTKNDIIIFIDANKKKIWRKINNRKNINLKLIKILRKNQFPTRLKKKKSKFIIKNKFIRNIAKKDVKLIQKKINK